ncbi:MAG TPA: hypothetical protein VKB67_12195 [Rhizomicrobium sp.]|nr:hypothetical protein [Rhizomicrobium sp.]
MRQSLLPLRQAAAAFDQSIRADLLAARKLLGAAIFIAACAATSAPAAAQPICISTRDIASTRVLDGGRAMVFRMRDGSEWRNDLRTRCNGLTFNGFSWTIRNPGRRVCANQDTLRVMRTGQTCVLGNFTQVRPPRSEQRTQQ